MEKKETRNKQIHFLVNATEAELIKKKMDEAGFTSVGAYMRKMAIDGYTIRLDLTDMREAIRLLRINSNNLNQYAKRANETGSIYVADIKQLQKEQEELWEMLKKILGRLIEI